jgi:hypothetical protein
VVLTAFGLAFAVKIVRVLAGAESDPNFPEGTAAVVMSLTYVPMILWGPLLAVATLAYHRRRSTAAPAPQPEAEIPDSTARRGTGPRQYAAAGETSPDRP